MKIPVLRTEENKEEDAESAYTLISVLVIGPWTSKAALKAMKILWRIYPLINLTSELCYAETITMPEPGQPPENLLNELLLKQLHEQAHSTSNAEANENKSACQSETNKEDNQLKVGYFGY